MKLLIVKMKMFDIQKDIWSLGFPFIKLIIPIHFNIALTFKLNQNNEMLKMSTGSKKKDLFLFRY